MTATICPYCGYNTTTGDIVKGGLKGVGVVALSAMNPFLGAGLISKFAYDAWINAGKKTKTCPNSDCGKEYGI